MQSGEGNPLGIVQEIEIQPYKHAAGYVIGWHDQSAYLPMLCF